MPTLDAGADGALRVQLAGAPRRRTGGRPGGRGRGHHSGRQHRRHAQPGGSRGRGARRLRWFQLYCYRDRGVTEWLVERAVAAGYRALCLTVDAPLVGRRERDARNRFALPHGLGWKNLEGVGLDQMEAVPDGSALVQYISSIWDASLTWEAVEWLRGLSPLPLVIKGILTAEDARLAVEHGAAAIVVSNHGGRQLDGTLPTSEALPEIVDAVAGRAEILVDGGIRRGSDILKALALGARAGARRATVPVGSGGGRRGRRESSARAPARRARSGHGPGGRPTIASIDRSLVC